MRYIHINKRLRSTFCFLNYFLKRFLKIIISLTNLNYCDGKKYRNLAQQHFLYQNYPFRNLKIKLLNITKVSIFKMHEKSE